MSLAEQLRDALAAYRRADDHDDRQGRNAAYGRLRDINDEIHRTTKGPRR